MGVLARFPSHVLVRVPIESKDDPTRDLYVDAFAGSVLHWEDLFEFVSGFGVPSSAEAVRAFVAYCPPQEVHARMLRNLRRIYEERREDVQLLAVLDQAIAIGDRE